MFSNFADDIFAFAFGRVAIITLIQGMVLYGVLAHLTFWLRKSYCDHLLSDICLSIHTFSETPGPIFFKLYVEFSEAIIAYDIKVDLCNQLHELHKYQRSRSFIDLGPRFLRFSNFKIFNPCPAEPGYTLSLQTVKIQLIWICTVCH